MTAGPAATLATCLAKFDPEVAALAGASLGRLRALLPGTKELVYDAYNALAVAFGTGERLGDTFVGIAVYPRHVNLTFARGADLEDPAGLLEGAGARIRHLRIEEPETLGRAAVVRLIRGAAARAGYRRGGEGEIIIKKIYARQRPRRR